MTTAPLGPRAATDPHDLTLPLYGAPFGPALSRFFRSYVRFSGRASRSEFWWPVLAWNLVLLLLAVVWMTVIPRTDTAMDVGFVAVGIVLLAIALPSWAVLVRRLHDANLSGWLSLLTLVPYVGGVVAVAFGMLSSNPAGERFDGEVYHWGPPGSGNPPEPGTGRYLFE